MTNMCSSNILSYHTQIIEQYLTIFDPILSSSFSPFFSSLNSFIWLTLTCFPLFIPSFDPPLTPNHHPNSLSSSYFFLFLTLLFPNPPTSSSPTHQPTNVRREGSGHARNLEAELLFIIMSGAGGKKPGSPWNVQDSVSFGGEAVHGTRWYEICRRFRSMYLGLVNWQMYAREKVVRAKVCVSTWKGIKYVSTECLE